MSHLCTCIYYVCIHACTCPCAHLSCSNKSVFIQYFSMRWYPICHMTRRHCWYICRDQSYWLSHWLLTKVSMVNSVYNSNKYYVYLDACWYFDWCFMYTPHCCRNVCSEYVLSKKNGCFQSVVLKTNRKDIMAGVENKQK